MNKFKQFHVIQKKNYKITNFTFKKYFFKNETNCIILNDG